MRKTLSAAIICLILVSCGQRQNNKSSVSIPDLQDQCARVLIDEGATWQQVEAALTPLCSALMTASDDESDLKQRLAAQQASYTTINLLSDKIESLQGKGVNIPNQSVKDAYNDLLYPSFTWFYDANEQLPNIWRDQYYLSNQNADKSVPGYFHLMLTLPTSKEEESAFHIFFPDTAEGDPKLILRRYQDDGSSEEDWNSQVVIEPEQWTKKNEVEEGFPMHAVLSDKETSMLCEYDVLYISFLSAPAPSGELGEVEMARIELGPMQIIRQEVLFE